MPSPSKTVPARRPWEETNGHLQPLISYEGRGWQVKAGEFSIRAGVAVAGLAWLAQAPAPSALSELELDTGSEGPEVDVTHVIAFHLEA